MIRLEAQQTTPEALRAEMKALAGVIRPLIKAMPTIGITVSHPDLDDWLHRVIEQVFDAEGYEVNIVDASRDLETATIQ